MNNNKQPNFINDERGGIAMPTCVVIYGLVILLCFVFNAGLDVVRKNEAQNAADAMAYSSGVVIARSLNTVSAINHCLGELTAMCVLLDALGGLEEDGNVADKKKYDHNSYTKLEEEYKNMIDKVTKTPSGYAAPFPAMAQFDKLICENVAKILLENPEKVKGFASLYDAKMKLLYFACECFKIKHIFSLIGDVVKWIPYVGQAISAIVSGVCLVVTGLLCYEIVSEYVVLAALDYAMPAVKKIPPLIREDILPPICRYAEIYRNPKLEKNPVPTALYGIQKTLRSEYKLRECVVSPSKEVLPVLFEQEPYRNQQGNKKNKTLESPWQDNDGKTSKAIKTIEGINDSISGVVDIIGPAADIAGAVGGILNAIGLGNTPFGKLTDAIGEFRKKKDDVPNTGIEESPSRKCIENDVKKNNFDIEYEQQTQWTRAANPYVDYLRSKIRPSLVDLAENSNLSTYFTHYTYRYMLYESHIIHKDSKNRMLVLKGFSPEKKGNELWTSDAEQADELFSVIAAVQIKERLTGIGDNLFKQPKESNDVAVAQAFVYAAGGRDLDAQKNKTLQPNTSWDTLQWKMSPTIKAPEWKAQASEKSSSLRIWDIFNEGGIKVDTGSTADVALNWQVKLTPITKTKLEQLSKEENYEKSKAVKEMVGFLLEKEHYKILNH